MLTKKWLQYIEVIGKKGMMYEHANVRIVYLETDWQTLLERNRSREDAVPQSVIEEMMGKMTLPEACEARKVEWWSL